MLVYPITLQIKRFAQLDNSVSPLVQIIQR